MKDREDSSPACGGRGVLECGRCMCRPPYSGGRCETNRLRQPPPPPPTPGDEQCRKGPEAPVCSGRGACEYGDCVLCGGHGRCQCGQCVCDAHWTGEACNCSMDRRPCEGAYLMQFLGVVGIPLCSHSTASALLTTPAQ
ncbi:hypothetical protein CRUP_010778 [Coryphaenoides rupestris]|nr:hypothetical protein CRUP_010778 [Coryphaenoides rupestris]